MLRGLLAKEKLQNVLRNAMAAVYRLLGGVAFDLHEQSARRPHTGRLLATMEPTRQPVLDRVCLSACRWSWECRPSHLT
jgi:hypothetical protein